MTSYRSLNHTKWACQYHVVCESAWNIDPFGGVIGVGN